MFWLVQTSSDGTTLVDPSCWGVDPYRSLPRLGTVDTWIELWPSHLELGMLKYVDLKLVVSMTSMTHGNIFRCPNVSSCSTWILVSHPAVLQRTVATVWAVIRMPCTLPSSLLIRVTLSIARTMKPSQPSISPWSLHRSLELAMESNVPRPKLRLKMMQGKDRLGKCQTGASKEGMA